MYNNILLLTDDDSNAQLITSKIALKRENNKVLSISSQKLKKWINNSFCEIILIDESQYNRQNILRIINIIKSVSEDIQVIIINSEETDEFMYECCINGASTFININATKYEYSIILKNVYKFLAQNQRNKILGIFLRNSGTISTKNGLITYKSLKESFWELTQDIKIKNGTYAILTIDEASKTKLSMNRLALALQNTLRTTDIIASGTNYYVLVFENTNINGAKFLLERLKNIMGKDIDLRAGLVSINGNNFAFVDKLAKDNLKIAIENNELSYAINTNQDGVFGMDSENYETHFYKLFSVAYNKKIENVIAPTFYRFEKECISKLKNCKVTQVANIAECYFSIKNNKNSSRLVIVHQDNTKLKISIEHDGLDSPENTFKIISINNLSIKELTNLLKQLYSEFLE